MLFAYVGFILLKAFYGYFKWGPLAFRHSALFYYPLFAIIGYYFYNKQFFKNNKISLLLLGILIFTALRIENCGYFLFTYFMLALLLSLKYKSKIIKYSCLFLLLAFFPYKYLFATSRSGLIANLAGILTFFFLLFLLLRIKLKYKALTASLGFVLIATGIFLFADKNAIKSLTSWNEIVNKYKEKNAYISQQEEAFRFAEIPAKIYAKNIAKDISTDDRYSEEEISILIKPLDKEEKIILAQNVAEKEKIVSLPKKKTVLFIPEKDPAKVVPSALTQKPSKEKIILAQNIAEKKLIQRIQIFPKNEVNLLLEDVSGIKSSDMQKVITEAYDLEAKRDTCKYRNLGTSYQNANFRLFIWRDMLSELFTQKPIFGFDFGRPLRSKSIEILNWSDGTWRWGGWIAVHNSYLHIIYRSGIIGILLIFAVFFALFKKAKVFILRRSLNGIILFSILIYWLTIANFLVILELPYNAIPFWALLGMTIKISNDLQKKKLLSRKNSQ